MSDRQMISAISTDCIRIESLGEGCAVTAAGWQWLNYRDEAIRVADMSESTRLILDGIQMLCQGARFEDLSERAKRSVIVKDVWNTLEKLRARLEWYEPKQAECGKSTMDETA